jgi:hypothetical protein
LFRKVGAIEIHPQSDEIRSGHRLNPAAMPSAHQKRELRGGVGGVIMERRTALQIYSQRKKHYQGPLLGLQDAAADGGVLSSARIHDSN